MNIYLYFNVLSGLSKGGDRLQVLYHYSDVPQALVQLLAILTNCSGIQVNTEVLSRRDILKMEFAQAPLQVFHKCIIAN